MQRPIEYGRIADLYDEFVRTTVDIPFFLDEARRASGPVLELMSGTGRVSLPLVEAGAELTCVDYSPEMLAVLETKLDERGLSATVDVADVRELDLGRRFGLILLPFNSFAELLSPEDQRLALARVRDHQAESGRFICTLHNPRVRLKQMDGRLRLLGEHPRSDGSLLVWIAECQDPETRLVEGVELFEEYDENGRLRAKRALSHRFRIIRRAEFEVMAEEAGLGVEALYGDYDRTAFDEERSPFMIWVLKPLG